MTSHLSLGGVGGLSSLAANPPPQRSAASAAVTRSGGRHIPTIGQGTGGDEGGGGERDANADAHEIRLLRAELRDKEAELAMATAKLQLAEDACTELRSQHQLGGTYASLYEGTLSATAGTLNAGGVSQQQRSPSHPLAVGAVTSAGGVSPHSAALSPQRTATTSSGFALEGGGQAAKEGGGNSPHSVNLMRANVTNSASNNNNAVAAGASAPSLGNTCTSLFNGTTNTLAATDAGGNNNNNNRTLTTEEAIAEIIEGDVSAHGSVAAIAAANARLSLKEVELMKLLKLKDTQLTAANAHAADVSARLAATKAELETTTARKTELEGITKASAERITSLSTDRGTLWERISELESIGREHERREEYLRARVFEVEGDNDLLRIQLGALAGGQNLNATVGSTGSDDMSDDFVDVEELKRRAAAGHSDAAGVGDGDAILANESLELSELRRQLRAAHLELTILKQRAAGASGADLSMASVRHHRNDSVMSDAGAHYGIGGIGIGQQLLMANTMVGSPPPAIGSYDFAASTTQRMAKSGARHRAGSAITSSMALTVREEHRYNHVSPAALTENASLRSPFDISADGATLFVKTAKYRLMPARNANASTAVAGGNNMMVFSTATTTADGAGGGGDRHVRFADESGDGCGEAILDFPPAYADSLSVPAAKGRVIVPVAAASDGDESNVGSFVDHLGSTGGGGNGGLTSLDATTNSVTAGAGANPPGGSYATSRPPTAPRPPAASSVTTTTLTKTTMTTSTSTTHRTNNNESPNGLNVVCLDGADGGEGSATVLSPYYDPTHQRTSADLVGRALVAVSEEGDVVISTVNPHLQAELLALLEAYHSYCAEAEAQRLRRLRDAEKKGGAGDDDDDNAGPCEAEVGGGGASTSASLGASKSVTVHEATAASAGGGRQRTRKDKGNECCVVM